MDTNIIRLTTLKEAWSRRYDGGIDGLSRSSGGNAFTGFIADIVSVVINLPLIATVVIIGVFFIYISRHSDAGK